MIKIIERYCQHSIIMNWIVDAIVNVIGMLCILGALLSFIPMGAIMMIILYFGGENNEPH